MLGWVHRFSEIGHFYAKKIIQQENIGNKWVVGQATPQINRYTSGGGGDFKQGSKNCKKMK